MKIEQGDLVKWNGQWGEVLEDFLNETVNVSFSVTKTNVLAKKDLKLVCKKKDRKDYFV